MTDREFHQLVTAIFGPVINAKAQKKKKKAKKTAKRRKRSVN